MTNNDSRIAVIGAGMTAAACVQRLSANIDNIDVFEKSRGAGGRMATRRLDNDVTADHGAQYFTAATPAFQQFIDAMTPGGTIGPWPVRDDKPCFVGAPHMNSPIKSVINGPRFYTSHLVEAVERRENNWWLTVNDDLFGPYDYVISTVPAPQAKAFSQSANLNLDRTLNSIKIAPCWALMLVFDRALSTDLKSWRDEHDMVGWVGRNSTKPGRAFTEDSWTVHATPGWSADNLEIEKEEAAELLFPAFTRIIGGEIPALIIKTAHRWRYAQTTVPLGSPYLSDPTGTLLIGGDWCLGAKVEFAYESGRSMADAVLS